VVALERTSDRTAAEIVGTVISERLIDTAALIALFAAASPWLPAIFGGDLLTVFSSVGLAASVALAVAGWATMRNPGLSASLARKLRLPRRLHRHLVELERGLTAMFSDWKICASGVSLTVASWLLIGGSNWLLLRSLDLRVSLAGGILIALATGIAMIIPSAPASLGVFEATTVLILRGYPVDHGSAVSYALTLHLLNAVPLVLVGGWALVAVGQRATVESARRRLDPRQTSTMAMPTVDVLALRVRSTIADRPLRWSDQTADTVAMTGDDHIARPNGEGGA
jgi:uncharacterized membrane protein YbhN (UPF0104 family)